MTDQDQMSRALIALAQSGITKTSVARGIGVNPADLAAMIDGSREPSTPAMLKLEAFTRETFENKLAALAQMVTFDGGCPLLVRALAPSIRRLAAVLADVESKLADAAGWPRRLTVQEQAERMARHNVEVAMIEAQEAALNAEIESTTGWGNPPPQE